MGHREGSARPRPSEPVFLEVAANFYDRSEDEQFAVCFGMAEELQRQLGLGKWADPEDQDEEARP